MVSFKIFVLAIICFYWCVHEANAALSEKQIQSAKKMITNICKPRTNVSDEALATMKTGNFEGLPREAQCFLNCVLVSNKWQNKNNTFNEAASLAAIKMLPEKYQTEAKEVINICKDSAKSLDDKCVSAIEISKCFFDNSDQIRKFVA